MKVTTVHIPGVLLLEPKVHEDSRGLFFESFNTREFASAINRSITFVQDNHSISRKGVLRGLHYQEGDHAQAKIVRVTRGAVQDVVVDIRPDSPTYGHHFSTILKAEERKMIFIPHGCAHGFLALEDGTEFLYKCDNYYEPAAERGIRYDDPRLGIEWMLPESEIRISKKDSLLPYLSAEGS